MVQTVIRGAQYTSASELDLTLVNDATGSWGGGIQPQTLLRLELCLEGFSEPDFKVSNWGISGIRVPPPFFFDHLMRALLFFRGLFTYIWH